VLISHLSPPSFSHADELYRKHADILNKPTIGLLLCDEGHRLKSSGTNKTIAALNAAPTKRRVIITGTPVQNDLEEFFAMCDFVNPDCLGALALFRRIYATPILASRDAAASADTSYIGQQRSEELNTITQSFMLRRDASINKKHLPPKQELFVFCRLAPLQRRCTSKPRPFRFFVWCHVMMMKCQDRLGQQPRNLTRNVFFRVACMRPCSSQTPCSACSHSAARRAVAARARTPPQPTRSPRSTSSARSVCKHMLRFSEFP